MSLLTLCRSRSLCKGEPIVCIKNEKAHVFFRQIAWPVMQDDQSKHLVQLLSDMALLSTCCYALEPWRCFFPWLLGGVRQEARSGSRKEAYREGMKYVKWVKDLKDKVINIFKHPQHLNVTSWCKKHKKYLVIQNTDRSLKREKTGFSLKRIWESIAPFDGPIRHCASCPVWAPIGCVVNQRNEARSCTWITYISTCLKVKAAKAQEQTCLWTWNFPHGWFLDVSSLVSVHVLKSRLLRLVG